MKKHKLIEKEIDIANDIIYELGKKAEMQRLRIIALEQENKQLLITSK